MKKSFTLALALMLTASTISFAQTVIWENSVAPIAYSGNGTTSANKIGQQFIVTSPNTSIQEVTLFLCKAGNVAANYIVSIYNDNGSNQIGTKIADIASGSNSTLATYSLTQVVINSTNCLNNLLPLTLNAGSKYWVVLTSSNSEYINWFFDNSDATVNGTGASSLKCSGANYLSGKPFFMKITAGAPVITSLDKTISDEMSVYASAKTISINSVFENYTVELTNAAGAKVLSQSVTQSGLKTIAADVAPGFYLVKVSAEGRSFIKKVLLR